MLTIFLNKQYRKVLESKELPQITSNRNKQRGGAKMTA